MMKKNTIPGSDAPISIYENHFCKIAMNLNSLYALNITAEESFPCDDRTREKTKTEG